VEGYQQSSLNRPPTLCSERYPRLAELAAQMLFEQQAARPLAPVDPALEALIPY